MKIKLSLPLLWEQSTETANATAALKLSFSMERDDKMKGKGRKSGGEYTALSFMHPHRSKSCAYTKFWKYACK